MSQSDASPAEGSTGSVEQAEVSPGQSVDRIRERLRERTASASAGTTAQTFMQAYSTASRPILVRCDDGREYVVKGSQAGRMLVNDHLVAKLGALLGAPVPEVELVAITPDLIAAQTEMSHMTAGLAHGSRFIPNCHDGGQHASPENRGRFARLAVLFGLVGASDHQYLHQNDPPHLVYSVDHGHFLPCGPEWTAQSLEQAGPASPDDSVVQTHQVTPDELAGAAVALEQVTDDAIVDIVGGLPSTWGVDEDDRLAMVAFFIRRREEMKAACVVGEATA
jgi:hypothetical protein